jgi:hypothetical protein
LPLVVLALDLLLVNAGKNDMVVGLFLELSIAAPATTATPDISRIVLGQRRLYRLRLHFLL